MRIMKLQLTGFRCEQIMVLKLISLRISEISNSAFNSRLSAMACSRLYSSGIRKVELGFALRYLAALSWSIF